MHRVQLEGRCSLEELWPKVSTTFDQAPKARERLVFLRCGPTWRKALRLGVLAWMIIHSRMRIRPLAMISRGPTNPVFGVGSENFGG